VRISNGSLNFWIDNPCSKISFSKEPKPQKKPTNHPNPIYCDTPTPEKPKEEFEVIEEVEDDSLSLAS
jgi:hypothetical protein